MGNFQSFSLPKDSSNNNNTPAWTLVAVSHALHITPSQLLELRHNCRVGSLGQKRTRPKISKTVFSKAMARSQMVQPGTVGILGHLFSMWDEDGTERVDYINFLTGISVLASCQDCESVQDVVLFALQVQDVHKTHCITRAKLESLLNGMLVCVFILIELYNGNVLAILLMSYFGRNQCHGCVFGRRRLVHQTIANHCTRCV